MKASELVQTIITLADERVDRESAIERLYKFDDAIAEMTENDVVTEEVSAAMEASDLLNYFIDRILWNTGEPECSTTKIAKDDEAQTYIKYNNSTKKIAIDDEAQTTLTCQPKDSNTMLLSRYTEVKNFCKDLVEECIRPLMIVDDILREMMDNYENQVNFPFNGEEIAAVTIAPKRLAFNEYRRRNLDRVESDSSTPTTREREEKRAGKKIKDILFAANRSYVVRSASEATAEIRSDILKVACPHDRRATSSTSTVDSSRTLSSLSLSRQAFTARDAQALEALKSAFCHRPSCAVKLCKPCIEDVDSQHLSK